MDERQTRKQIQQMCRFIEQEANEKVNEIKLRTEQERDKQLAFLALSLLPRNFNTDVGLFSKRSAFYNFHRKSE